jgi:hypothetical protein
MKRIVRDQAAPHQAPQGFDGLARIASACRLVQRIEEAGSSGFKNCQQLFFALRKRLDKRPLLGEQWQLVSEEESDAAIPLSDGLDAGPRNFAGSDKRIETRWRIVRNARRKNGRLDERRGQRCALKALNRIEERIEVSVSCSARCEQTLPVRKEARQRVLLHWLNFAAQLGERLAANLAENLRVAPLAMETARTESALEHTALAGELPQRVLHSYSIQRKSVRGLA